MVKAFIFDVDGTLIDSNDYHAKAWQRALAAHGKDVALKSIRPLMGKGGDQLLPHFLNKEEMAKLENTISKERGEIFKRDYLPQVQPFAKVRELFRAIRNADGRIALASSSKQEEVEQYQVIAQIEDLVEKATTSDQAESSKPEPDIFRAAMKLLGNPAPNSVLVVGDTPYDGIAATRAGLPVIGFLCGGFSEKELLASGCRELFRDPEDLLQNLDRIIRHPPAI